MANPDGSNSRTIPERQWAATPWLSTAGLGPTKLHQKALQDIMFHQKMMLNFHLAEAAVRGEKAPNLAMSRCVWRLSEASDAQQWVAALEPWRVGRTKWERIPPATPRGKTQNDELAAVRLLGFIKSQWHSPLLGLITWKLDSVPISGFLLMTCNPCDTF